ncbi:MAG: Hpt domain-containing protein [Nitrospiraceae bacterium]
MSDEMQEILNDFLTESNEMLEVLDQRFVALESDPTNKDLLNEIFRAMHSMKGSAIPRVHASGGRGASRRKHSQQAPAGEMAVVPAVISVILEAVDITGRPHGGHQGHRNGQQRRHSRDCSQLYDIINGKVGEAAMPAAPPSATPAAAAQVELALPSEPAHVAPTLGEILAVNEGLASSGAGRPQRPTAPAGSEAAARRNLTPGESHYRTCPDHALQNKRSPGNRPKRMPRSGLKRSAWTAS